MFDHRILPHLAVYCGWFGSQSKCCGRSSIRSVRTGRVACDLKNGATEKAEVIGKEN
jgi:hypothetical protein